MSSTRTRRFALRIIAAIHEYIVDLIIFAGCILAVFLVVTSLPLTVQWQTATTNPKDAIDIYAKAFAVVVSFVGICIGYRKYVKGRLFSERADLSLAVRPIRWSPAVEAEDTTLLHEATVQIKNTGSVAIWQPDIELRALALSDDGSVTASEVGAGGLAIPTPLFGIEAVEPNATYVGTYWFRVSKSITEFRVAVDVQSLRKTAWHRTVLVANCFTAKDDEGTARAAAPAAIDD